MSRGNRIAIVDCGTNTFHLLIGEQVDSKTQFLHRSKLVVKIGNKTDPFSPIPEKALERAFSALSSFHSTMKKFMVNRVIATGTAALRDSANAPDFLSKVKQKLGFDIRLIPGELEAELICAGVRKAARLNDTCSIIMDIGGGSTEFILCDAHRIHWKKSYRLGAARLLAWWTPGDPPNEKQMEQLNDLFRRELVDLIQLCQALSPEQLIGASGSFETIVSLISRGNGLPIPRRNEIDIQLQAYQEIHQKLITSTKSHRLIMPGMLRMRADMMVPASLLISFVVQNTGIRNMKLSRFALKEGLFFESMHPTISHSALLPSILH